MNSMTQFYTRINWYNKSDNLTTPLGKTNLNRMDSAIKTLDGRVVEVCTETIRLDAAKADKTLLNNMLTNWSIDNTTGIVTLTKYNGTHVTINTALNKLAVNFVYDAVNQQLIITQSDGTKQYVDMSALITQYEFLNSDTVAFVVQPDGKVKADVINGSITKEKLDPNVLALITTSESNIEEYLQQVQQYVEDSAYNAKLSQSYAIGLSGIRDMEDTDNSKYYKEQSENFSNSAKEYRDQAHDYLEDNQGILEEIIKKTTMAEFSVDDDGHLIYTNNSTYKFVVSDDGNLRWGVV